MGAAGSIRVLTMADRTVRLNGYNVRRVKAGELWIDGFDA
jgi:hypothetical protein